MPFSLVQILVPFADAYRPLWTALGIAAAELLVALAVTNRYRKRFSYRFWRRAHYLNFAVWGFALVHGLFAGTDAGSPWATTMYLGSAAAVGGLLAWRLTKTVPVAAGA
jgi:predicted ferric reductase